MFKLCVYDRNGVVRARAHVSTSCGGVPCRKQITGGWRYTSKDTLPDGLTGLLLKGGDVGKAKIKVTSFSARSAPEVLRLSTGAGNGGDCWRTATPRWPSRALWRTAEHEGVSLSLRQRRRSLTPQSNDNQGRLQAHVDRNEVPIHSRLWRYVES